MVYEEPDEPDHGRRRWLLVSGVVAVVAVGLVVAIAVVSSRGTPEPPVSSGPASRVSTTTSTTTTTTVPLPPNTAVTVQVLNASGSGDLATNTASALKALGFPVSGINNAPSVIASAKPSDIFYGPTGLPAAHTLANVIDGPVTFVPDSSLTGNNVSLWIANAQMSVTTTTTGPSTP
ncbi:MAG: LytR C-terminal domain-containing protein [Acidimicrobiales bacterium]